MSVERWWEGLVDDDRSDEQLSQARDEQVRLQESYITERQSGEQTFSIITSAEAHDLWLAELERPTQGSVSTGWVSIDRTLGRPLCPGEVCVIAARTGVGKTWVLQHLVERTLQNDPAAGAVFMTMEMPEHEMAHRVAAHVTGLSPGRVEEEARAGGIESGEVFIERRATYLRRLVYFPKPNTLATDIEKVIDAAIAQGQAPTVLVVDYTGLLGGLRGQSSYDRASQNARELKEIAKGYNILVLAAVQLSRAGGREGQSEPSLDALRDSGVIEEAADRVLMFWRESMGAMEEGGHIFCKIAKNRHGATTDDRDRVTLEFDQALRLREVASEDLYRAEGASE